MTNKSTLFYSVSQVKVLNEIYWQKGPVTFKLCKSLENSTDHGPGGQHYCRTLVRPDQRMNCSNNDKDHPSIISVWLHIWYGNHRQSNLYVRPSPAEMGAKVPDLVCVLKSCYSLGVAVT